MPIVVTAVADSQDELPEALRAVAKEQGGKWHVTALPDGWALDNTKALRNAFVDEKERRKDLAERVARFESVLPKDADPAEVAKAYEAYKGGTLRSSKEIDEFKAALEGKTSAQIKAAQDARAKADAQLAKLLVDGQLSQALAAHGFGRHAAILTPLLRERITVEDSGDTKRVVLKDEQGRMLISKKPGNNDPMDVAEFVAGLRDQPEYKMLCETKATGGTGGASQGGGSARTGDSADITKMSPAEMLLRGMRAKTA
jgi:hypothetical protein